MDVTVYSTPTCPYCKMVKEFLESKGVKSKFIISSTGPIKNKREVVIKAFKNIG